MTDGCPVDLQSGRGRVGASCVQTAEHGRSMEAEARVLLAAPLSGRRPPRGLGSDIAKRFADIGGVDLDTVRSQEPARAADLSA